MKRALLISLSSLAAVMRLEAVPPLVSGDAPTADKETFEWYVGLNYLSEGPSIEREMPVTELVYGISDRQEVTLEMRWLSQDGAQGFGDTVVGTKYMFLKDKEALPALASTFEIKLPTASAARGLGSGETDYDLRVICEKTWGRFTAIGNVGYTWVGDPASGPLDNVWFLSCAQEYELTPKVKWLSEVYFATNEQPGAPDRLAANVGLEYKLRDNFKVHGAIGRSLRANDRGGPNLYAYVGFEWDFDAPWKHSEK